MEEAPRGQGQEKRRHITVVNQKYHTRNQSDYGIQDYLYVYQEIVLLPLCKSEKSELCRQEINEWLRVTDCTFFCPLNSCNHSCASGMPQEQVALCAALEVSQPFKPSCHKRRLSITIPQFVFADKYALQHSNTSSRRGPKGYKADLGYYSSNLRRKKEIISEEDHGDFFSIRK